MLTNFAGLTFFEKIITRTFGDYFIFYKPLPKLKVGIYNCRMEIFSEGRSELIHSIETKWIIQKKRILSSRNKKQLD